ncbi:hypothetical protein DICPUDRAFT_91080 [Dictyostelium purpureum]|uniref:Carbohydrate binding domain-containing protein n=1 Tax=Dictyostelium purpureum TaxID=5786 RepID=F0Z7B7_DICPU|nr:uncharacterized protein DICPUDRAFT_91080 [Dictyostelium purpureum]EGC40149.1 hypothetical protein DICPUDRAFT_91080 [Dictyostelium purpureum]|eukprot:XP_003283339.1 hypothetical protein DICPUDRAFT_91080 [Dictyostelium purpureum]
MKYIIVLLFALLTISFSAATYPCGNGVCSNSDICRTFNNVPGCTPRSSYTEITLSSKVVNIWYDGNAGKWYTQYDITISNNSNYNLKQINIGTANLNLRDPQSLWNMVKSPSGVLSLPSYQQSINAHASYVFGYILVGQNQPATLSILSVNF